MNPLLRALLVGVNSATRLFSTLGLNAGDPFIIAAGATVILDMDTPSLGYTDISGTLKTDGAARTLTTTGIGVHSGGTLQLGTAAVPLSSLTTISLTGAYVPLTLTTINGLQTPTNPGLMRAIMVESGGTIDLHGTPPAVLWTTLGDHAAVAANSLTLAAPPNWLTNDPVIVAITDFPDGNGSVYGGQTEQFTLTADAFGTTASLSSGLASSRWGKLQYPIDVPVAGSGISLTQGTFSAKKAHANVPTVLDERARVANLRRNLVITCPNDSDWSTKGHGVVVMWMAGSIARIDGAQIRRGGQRGAIGRYPFHSHMWSWDATTGGFLGNASSNYVKRSVVWTSENRAFTCHGTNGMEWSDNVGYDIKGHAFFQEDGSEGSNKFYRNLMLHVRAPAGGYDLSSPGNESEWLRGSALPGSFSSISGNGTTTTVNWTAHGLYSGQTISVSSASISGFNVYRFPVTVVNANQFTYPSTGNGTPTGTVFRKDNDQLKVHDAFSGGFWITNLGNDIQDNYASDCVSGDFYNFGIAGSGVWISLAPTCLGLSHLVAVSPIAVNTDTLARFVCHSNSENGMKLADGTSDELGLIRGVGKYVPASGSFQSSGHVFWKNSGGAYFNGVGVPDYIGWTVADNAEQDFFGSTNSGGQSHQHLAIAFSLNNANAQPAAVKYPRACFTPYHGTVRFFDMTAINYPYAPVHFDFGGDRGRGGGVSQGGTDSYDAVGIDVYSGRNTNIQLVNSHYGPQAVPLHLQGLSGLSGPYNYSIAGAYHDLDGKYGTAGKFQIPITPATGLVDAYFLTGATNLADGPTTGTVVCKTTDTRFFGLGIADSITIHSNTIDALGDYRLAPITSTRQDIVTGATIGTPFKIFLGGGNGLSIFRAFPVQAGGRFQIDFTDGTTTIAAPSTYQYLHIANANVAGDFVILGLPWSGSVVPRVCFGSHMSNESTSIATNSGSFTFNSFASAADVAANRAIIATAGASLAAVVADTTGATFWRDTVNNRVWIRYTTKPFPANTDPYSLGLNYVYDVQYISIKA